MSEGLTRNAEAVSALDRRLRPLHISRIPSGAGASSPSAGPRAKSAWPAALEPDPENSRRRLCAGERPREPAPSLRHLRLAARGPPAAGAPPSSGPSASTCTRGAEARGAQTPRRAGPSSAGRRSRSRLIDTRPRVHAPARNLEQWSRRTRPLPCLRNRTAARHLRRIIGPPIRRDAPPGLTPKPPSGFQD